MTKTIFTCATTAIALVGIVTISFPKNSLCAAVAKIDHSHTIRNGSIGNWEPPKHLPVNFPFYVSGFDHEKRPIWICEIGKWNMREEIEKGPQHLEHFNMYMDKFFYLFIQGSKLFFKQEDRFADDSACIIDWENFNLLQFSHGPTLRFVLGHFAKFQEFQESLAYGFFINANAVADSLMNLAKPILGSALERIEIYGTQKSRWVPRLLRKMEKSQLPSWYGGDEGEFKPIVTFG